MILDEHLVSPDYFYRLMVDINEDVCGQRIPPEPTFVAQESLLRSVAASPFQFHRGQYATIVYVTASLVRNHPFHQGNKSTAMQVFLVMTHLMRNDQPSTKALNILEDRIVEIATHPSWDTDYFFELLIGTKE